MGMSSTQAQTQQLVPPGFRFHPTDEELVDYYLRKKVASRRIDLNVIKDVDLYKIEPWDLQEKCRLGGPGEEEQNEWYFFSHKDKKYPTGTRTNRATAAGFWKATGRDKPIYANKQRQLVGMRKTLVYYKGRAPNGHKSDWIMHEYRLETNENGPPQEEGWVVCRVFKKRLPTTRRESDHDAPCWYLDEDGPFMHDLNSPMSRMPPHHAMSQLQEQHLQMLNNTYKRELKLQFQMPSHHVLNTIPHELESPSFHSLLVSPDHQSNSHHAHQHVQLMDDAVDQVTDWRVLDKFVASQLSHDATKGVDYTDEGDIIQVNEKQEVATDYASTSTSSSQVDPWK
ncbi:NAC domain-containing protein 105-like isoform X2 [Panicum virgatum]|uniref:Secondary wall NAC master switch n=2 Tax=Panicum virgatum TaxID=38727 RepID=A0A0K1TPD7_PANVG|nr:NAC domain-containing protein 105-like isoform X2 [Panicum virgatum]XP_039842007.1 NAC domain-containing protein 105-like isoform X2 [Panicum virgatum]XP_039842008.1 NAC domain-containing protein 105-like isoform X2 [Panicum virgatum]AKV89234.1 secondary wall NAC master switch [Panicum virgatum]KAG2608838.1 hypothetical protein PVAP13_4KG010900 [Panicum virgatum]